MNQEWIKAYGPLARLLKRKAGSPMSEVKLEHRQKADAIWRASNDPAGADFGPELLAQALADAERGREWKRKFARAVYLGDVTRSRSKDEHDELNRLLRDAHAALKDFDDQAAGPVSE